MKLNKWIAVTGALLISGVAFAAWYGKWNCADCAGGYPTPDPDTRNFISMTVNQAVPIWRSGDTVTICNGEVCIKYEYTGMYWLGRSRSADTGNSTGGGGGGGGGGYYGGGAGSPGCIYGCDNEGVVTVGDPERTDS